MTYKQTANGVIVPIRTNIHGKRIRDNQENAYANPLGGLTTGGYANSMTGAGGYRDKSEYGFYTPTRIVSRSEMETLYNQSWAAAKFIDIPIDDMFIRWREFTEMSNEAIERMQEVEKQFEIESNLNAGMKAGRLYGTGLVVMITQEAPMTTPLRIDRIQRGDLLNVLSFDRFDATVLTRSMSLKSKNYGKPRTYKINLQEGGSIEVHYSRILRFDGKLPLTRTGWQNYDRDWGVASIVPIVAEIMQDSGVSKGVAHLVNEASVGVQKIENFADAVSGNCDDGELTIAQRMEAVTLSRGLYRTVYMDSADDFQRVEVTFAGLPDLLDGSAKRLSGAADIPATRFWGQAPLGLNATGEGDMKNYDLKIKADQEKQLTNPLFIYDQVAARHAGITEPIKYEFPSLIDSSDNEQATTLQTKSTAIVPLVQTGIITEDEGRAALDGDPVLGNLEIEPDEIDEITEFKRKQKELESGTPELGLPDPAAPQDSSFTNKLKKLFAIKV